MGRDMKDLLGPDEGVVLETRQHWFVVLRSVGVHALGLIVLAGAIWYVGEPNWVDGDPARWISIALWLAFVAVALIVAWRILAWVTERFYVTTSKIVYARGILNRQVVSTPLVKIDEMTLQRPLLGRMLGYGRLDVENAAGGTEPLAGLEYLPKPTKLYQLISERSRNQRMVEGGAHRDEDNDGLVDPAAPAEKPAGTREDGTGRWVPSGDPTSGD